MSTSLASKPLTMAQRSSEAGRQAAGYLRTDDEKRMLAALAEVAVEEMQRNPGFALRVRGRYEELAPAKPPRAVRPKTARSPRQSKMPQQPKRPLVPIKQIDSYEINVARALDPYFLLEVYGAEQLRDALEDQTRDNLREAVAIVKEHNPRTRPAGASIKAMIDYIVQYVTP